MRAYLFYANDLVQIIDYKLYEWDEYGHIKKNYGMEIYNGGYLYFPDSRNNQRWIRCDLTPVLIEDAPKELRALVLILGAN